VSSAKPPKPHVGASGLPRLDDFEQDVTTTRQTDPVMSMAPASRMSARPMLLVVAGLEAGRLIAFDRDMIVFGRGPTCDVVLPDDGVSRKHAIIRRRGDDYVLEDLRSKNGTFVEGEPVLLRPIGFDVAFQLGPNVVVRLAMMTQAEARLAMQLYDSAMRDPLTQCFNRRYFFERLGSEIAYAERHRTAVSLIVFDFDHFKRLNDVHGHAAGDDVLRLGAARVLEALRTEDVLARIGGEEFAVVLRGIDHKNALICGERVRRAVEAGVSPVRATISAGVATTDDMPTATSQGLFAIADRRLYEAKEAGRNQVRGRTP
jgi:two-component system cell cycle response regulator